MRKTLLLSLLIALCSLLQVLPQAESDLTVVLSATAEGYSTESNTMPGIDDEQPDLYARQYVHPETAASDSFTHNFRGNLARQPLGHSEPIRAPPQRVTS